MAGSYRSQKFYERIELPISLILGCGCGFEFFFLKNSIIETLFLEVWVGGEGGGLEDGGEGRSLWENLPPPSHPQR